MSTRYFNNLFMTWCSCFAIIFIFIILVVSVSGLAFAKKNKQRIALKVSSFGVPNNLLLKFSKILKANIAKKEGKNMEILSVRDALNLAKIKSKGKRKGKINLADCTDSSCLARIGKALNAKKIIDVHIGLISGFTLVNLKIVDVNKIKIISRFREMKKQSLVELEKSFAANIASALEQKISDSHPGVITIVVEPLKHSKDIDSAEAEIYTEVIMSELEASGCLRSIGINARQVIESITDAVNALLRQCGLE